MEDNHLSSLLGSMELEEKNTKKVPTTFDKLPIELRLKVWKELGYIPRNIDVWEVVEAVDNKPSGRRLPKYRSYNAIPPILHVSHEARTVGLEHYTLSFGTKSRWEGKPVGPSFGPKIYANFEVDFICPMGTSPERFMFQNSLISLLGSVVPLRRLAVLCNITFYHDEWTYLDLMEFHNIEELVVFGGKLDTFQSLEKTFQQTSSPRFSFDFITLDEAKERGHNMSAVHDLVPRELTSDQKEVQSKFERYSKFPRVPLSVPTVKIMYMLAPTEKA